MKKLFLLFGLLVSAINLSAENKFYIPDMTVRPGEVAYVTVMCELDEGVISTGYTMFISIPEEITPYTTVDEINGGYDIESENGSGCQDWSLGTNYTNGTYRFLSYSPTATPIPTGEAVSLVIFPVVVSADVAPGTELLIKSTQLDLSTVQGGTSVTDHPLPFEGKIIVAGEDDASTFVALYDNYASYNEFPTFAGDGNFDVRVYRTLEAGKWNTIVVPFDMDNRRLKATFGDDVKVADFTDWETSDDGEIDIKFTNVESMKANTPYIIKVTKDITDYFYANNVKVNPVKYPGKIVVKEVERDTYTSNFYGSYFIDKIPANNLFIQDNMFYYSVQENRTTIKGFRGFFKVEGASASAKIGFMVDNDEVTSIEGLQINNKEVVNGDIYSISGQYLGKDVDRLHRGVYIVNGKKYVKK